MAVQKKIIFLHSQSPRSGHNFIAEVVRQVVDSETAIDLRSEIPLAPVLQAIQKTKEEFYKSAGASEYIDNLFMTGLRDRILTTTNTMIKYTSFSGAGEARSTFPDDIHILCFRDPRDCLISIFKGQRFKSDFKSAMKKLLLPFGIYHFWYARLYSSRIIKAFPGTEGFFLLRYEDLVKREFQALDRLIELFQSKKTRNELIEGIDQIQVINSSFYKEETSSKAMWNPSKPTKRFNPINRTRGFNILQLWGINLGSRPLRKLMGYI